MDAGPARPGGQWEKIILVNAEPSCLELRSKLRQFSCSPCVGARPLGGAVPGIGLGGGAPHRARTAAPTPQAPGHRAEDCKDAEGRKPDPQRSVPPYHREEENSLLGILVTGHETTLAGQDGWPGPQGSSWLGHAGREGGRCGDTCSGQTEQRAHAQRGHPGLLPRTLRPSLLLGGPGLWPRLLGEPGPPGTWGHGGGRSWALGDLGSRGRESLGPQGPGVTGRLSLSGLSPQGTLS